MKALFSLVRRMHDSLSKIHLVDRCLVFFMCILLLQTGYSLFFDGAATHEDSGVDTVVRTSTAAIFGYFISANFIKSGSTQSPNAKPPTIRGKNADGMQNRIGFSEPASGEEPALTNGQADSTEGSEPPNSVRLQVLIITHVGLAALIILIAYRNFGPSNPSAPAILSQLRDFVSGCVGFLIGTETTQK